MEVILTEDVPNLGEMGEIVKVAPGYGRNFLIPKGMALPASATEKKALEHKKRQIELRKEREREEAMGVQAKLDGVSITIPKRVAEGDALYGSVTSREIADVLKQEGFELEHRFIEVGRGIDELGIYKVPVKLASGVYAHVVLWVVAM
ncbi:50S ribosomal protein L9 [Lujinxingia litoralis]|uniref:Large ribosomal subunit protein bL9 n=1 Tax=Lujinxingia litoralis TaxID=2211119 RepID=A0A328C7V0_9DELT|nr:50S ribosomal protein L9 [Lujinxingia litoralis]RAL24637.1 50S ribosomal protein L9 [Lujinxingia litoralis]